MLRAPVKNMDGESSQHHPAILQQGPTRPQKSAGVPESQACPSFSCFATSVLIRIQHFNGKDTENFDGRSASCHCSKLSTWPRSVVFPRQEDMKGTSQAQRHPPSSAAPPVKRPDEEREHRKETLARIQHIFCASFILRNRLTILAETPQNDLARGRHWHGKFHLKQLKFGKAVSN